MGDLEREGGGFTLRYRKRWKGQYHLNPLRWVLMSWFIDHAAWEEKTVRMPGKKPIKLKRGQVAYSENQLANFFKIGRQQIRGHQRSMIMDGFLTKQVTQGVSVATIVNYDRYQFNSCKANQAPNQHPTSTPTSVPLKETKEYKEKGRDKSPTEKEKEQIAEAAQRRADSTTKYLNELETKPKVIPAVKTLSGDIKSKLRDAAKRLETNFK